MSLIFKNNLLNLVSFLRITWSTIIINQCVCKIIFYSVTKISNWQFLTKQASGEKEADVDYLLNNYNEIIKKYKV